MSEILKLSAYLLVIINPVSKMAVLAALSESHSMWELATSLGARR